MIPPTSSFIGKAQQELRLRKRFGISLLAINRHTFLQLVKTQPEFGVALLSAAAERVRFMASR